jgi:hypothetical protein
VREAFPELIDELVALLEAEGERDLAIIVREEEVPVPCREGSRVTARGATDYGRYATVRVRNFFPSVSGLLL